MSGAARASNRGNAPPNDEASTSSARSTPSPVPDADGSVRTSADLSSLPNDDVGFLSIDDVVDAIDDVCRECEIRPEVSRCRDQDGKENNSAESSDSAFQTESCETTETENKGCHKRPPFQKSTVATRRRDRSEKRCDREARRKARDGSSGSNANSNGRRRRRRLSSSASSSVANSSIYNISAERMKELRDVVEKAAQNQKTFTILGRYPSIRDALKSRGWVQNFDLNKLMSGRPRLLEDHVAVLARLQSADESERLFISRLLRHTPISFLWATSENIDWNSLCKNTLVSRFPRVYFTTKVGICTYLQQSHWFCEEGVSFTKFPRCYNISSGDDLDIFIRDFRITACLGLLKKLIQDVDEDKDIFSDSGKIPLKAVEFAVKRCWEVVAKEEHEDIDSVTEEQVWDHQWDQFLTYYYQYVHENSKFVEAIPTQIHEMYTCAKVALESIEPFWPQFQMDGTNNLWIVKPGAKSRGRGILVFNKLEDIISRVSTFNNNEVRFVVQKYIERPLLIHNTKFDIRQWFLVTSVYPLTIWMYKESYLRFCSQLFSLKNMHESVHLSNNAIQCKYKNHQKRDRALPDENMWDCYTFKAYLRTIGMSEHWESVIYSGMRECITGALLAAQEHMEHRRNCFELYGADFMLTEDLVPWLIEINSSPCMSPTTSVTARMCAQCLEDAIKVVIDRRSDKDADTGMFELAYRQQVSNPQPYMGMNLTVKGNRIARAQGTKPNRGATKDPTNQDNVDSREAAASPVVREAIKRLSEELDERRNNQSDEPRSAGSTNSRLNTSSSGVSSGGYSEGGLSSGVSTLSPRPPPTYKKHNCVRRTGSISQAVARWNRQGRTASACS
ncbi:Tubulin-tyrosine ligase family [Nesidiocoris tenuis]|uniref:Tubulin-tyrosine ligase family n=1 Tax=Nesidiocoris tenuis TaxID=355587 RepID=A0ABN7ACA1_9HEMI|nr:Tubulin-tyrosine ligase family [Nesidiocoris tenuis]